MCGCNGWLLLTSSRPLHEPPWGILAIGSAIVLGPVIAIVCAIHLSRESNERGLAWVTFLTNVAAAALAIMTVI